MRENVHIDIVKIIEILVLSLGSIVTLFPFIWMISTSFKTPPQIISYPPTLIPKPPTLEYYTQIFTKLNFGRFFLNSGYISVIITASALLTSSFVGYVFAKFNFWGKEVIFMMILSTMMIPFAVTMIPLYLIISKLGWINSHLALIIPGLYSTFGIFLMRQFMSSIPNELREAAIVDGCGEFRTFWSIILPQCKPVLAALGIFTFMWNWDNFLWPLIVLNNEDKFTLPVGLSMFSQQWWTNYGLVMAGATISVIPVLIVFFIFQKQFIQGIVLTGLKM
ncbi:MAG: carbohydrate ABC transporter permease [Dictyoglomi bacterium]|jgi:multiple sugar transport system permease protein|nr:carbohydrate ABC transporter permease [Dictyoglomota bacterium]HHV80205.1 carbohydrate ABC transporter permease [bacterium]